MPSWRRGQDARRAGEEQADAASSSREEGPEGPGATAAGGDGGEGPGTASSRGGRRRHRREAAPRPLWKELPLLVVAALVLALVIKTFLVQAFSIPSGSMENTLLVGDRVLVDKLTPWFGSEPERGEVVVFHDPGGWLAGEPATQTNALQDALAFVGLSPSSDERDLIKRVIGVGGDTVKCSGTGPVRVNGKALDEPYVQPGNTPCTQGRSFTVKVPRGDIWVMGDHRQDSADSSYWHQVRPGHEFVPVDDVVGRAFAVAWPISQWTTLPVPSTFKQLG
ncbi:signal peptidase I [Streptomyces sp. NPDC059740]|uniref:signal peptidase I n=1 Tax=Streptomyces sp. NPDC059740 TaxID=3346926 RepID=UPI003657B292